MFKEAQAQLGEKVATTEQYAQNALSIVTGLTSASNPPFNLEAPFAGTSGGIADIQARAISTLDLLRSIAAVPPERLELVPKTLFNFGPTIDALINQFQSVINQMNAVIANGGAGVWNPSDFTLSSANGSVVCNFSAYYPQIDTTLDTLLDLGWRVSAIAGTAEADSISHVTKPISDIYARLQQSQQNIDALVKQATTLSQKLSEEATEGSKSSTVIAASKTDSEANSAAIKAHLDAIQALLATIQQTNAQADVLKAAITTNQAALQDFEGRLTQRRTEFSEGTGKLAALLNALNDSNTTALEYINNSKVALGWSTASGLAQSFSTTANDLNGPIQEAKNGLYVSIGIFVALSFAAFSFVGSLLHFPDIAPAPGEAAATALLHVITATSIRLAILGPALFLVVSFNKRYWRLFEAREQYTFKKTVASAIPGFKEQAAAIGADDHVKAMTAAAFERLLFNPEETATRDLAITVRGGRLSRWLVRLIKDALEDARKEGKGPT